MGNEKIFRFMESGMDSLLKSTYRFEDPTGQGITHNPFFVSFLLINPKQYNIDVVNGSLLNKVVPSVNSYICGVDIRMGDYKKGGGRGFKDFALVDGLEEKACLDKIWLSTNDAFWNCIEDYGERNLKAIGCREPREKYLFLSQEPPEIFIDDEKDFDVNLGEVEDSLRRVTENLFKDNVIGSEASFVSYRENKYFVNSEGSRIFMSYVRHRILLRVKSQDSKNRVIPHIKVFYALNGKDIPTYDNLMEEGEKLKQELSDIVKSPVQKNGVYPIIMDPSNHGVLWHEVIGHALEGHRMQEGKYGGKTSLFLGKIGSQVAPDFISLYDDPTIADLDGSYPYDDEGVKAQRVELIKDGVLRNYLHSRQSAGFFNTNSNAHARSSRASKTTPRMSNLVIESSNSVSLEELKENMIKECEKQGKDYGLIFEGCGGGLTLPEESYFQTFPSKVFRLDRKGNMNQVRGIYVVGTPYQAMSNIIQTSDQFGVFNGVCGAESGFIPSTQRTPHALISSLEVNRIPSEAYEERKDVVVQKPKL